MKIRKQPAFMKKKKIIKIKIYKSYSLRKLMGWLLFLYTIKPVT